MTYLCTFYINSGFNVNNIPDSGALLETVTRFNAPALEILQDENLSRVAVKATYTQIKDADYCKIGSCYYFIPSGGIVMSSTDVAQISLIPDYITTAGLANLSVIDGVTERVHVAKVEDTFGAFNEEDELMSPVQPMELKAQWVSSDDGKVYGTFVESVLDLEAMGFDDTGVTYTDANTQESVTVPQTIGKDDNTTYEIYDGSNSHTSNISGTKLYRFVEQQSAYTALQKGIAKAFAMGIENGGVINKFRLPLNVDSQQAIQVNFDSGTVPGSTEATRGVDTLVANKITFNTGNDLVFDYASNVKNEKINYSPYSQYGIMTASGERMEVDPSNLAYGGTSPKIVEYDDPHGDGRPYFRFQFINGDSSWDGFWRNCVSGLQWKQTPMIFTEKQGSALDKLNYNMDADIAKDKRYNQRAMTELQQAGNIASGFGAAFSLDAAGVLSTYANAFMLSEQDRQNEVAYRDQRLKSNLDFGISQSVIQPQINFPYNSEVIRDFIGNGALVYRYRYTSFDIARIDRLLTMYGYKYTKILERSDCFNRSKFNYVKTVNASFTGAFPRWLLDGVARQFNGGIRIWHILPTPTAYSDNP